MRTVCLRYDMVEGPVVTFKSGATRSADKTFDPEGFLNPRVLERFSEYMEIHRKQSDGKMRAADNWQKGMSIKRYRSSLMRHYFDYWLLSRGYKPHSPDSYDVETVLCAILFNVQGLLLEELRKKRGKGK